MIVKAKTNSEKHSGQITVFLSLILVLILSLIFTIIETVRIQTAKGMISNIMDMGLDSVLAEYNRELLQTYDLFFIDGAYESESFSKNNIKERLQEYMSFNYYPNKGFEYIGNTDLWKLQSDGVSVLSVTRASDYEGEVLRNQAVDYIKSKVGLDKLVKIRDILDTNKTRAYEENSFEKKWKANKDRFKSEKENIEDEEIKKKIQVSLIDSMERMKSKSVLKLVLEDEYTISNKQIGLSDIPSVRSLPQEEIELVLEEDRSETLAEIMYDEYILEKFSSYLHRIESDVLDYQVEYILMGMETDYKNLEGVVNKILLIREGINFSYLLLDSGKRQEAYDLALALVGFTGSPPLIIATQMSLLLSWAFGESVMDVRALLSGGKVPFFKNMENWKLQLGNLSNLKNDQNENQTGLCYEDYLRIFLFANGKGAKKLRVMDMIELTLKNTKGNENFKIEHLISRVNVYSSWKVDSLFLTFPFLKDINYSDQGYLFEIEMMDAY